MVPRAMWRKAPLALVHRQGVSSTQTAAGLARADTARRAAAERLARGLPSTGLRF